MAGFDYRFLQEVERELKFRKQVLVEVTSQTKWEQLGLVWGDEPPVRGYALASSATFTKRREEKAYVTDVNFDHRWRQLEDEMDAIYPNFRSVAAAFGVK